MCKSNKKLTSIEAALQDETIRSKYTRDELEAMIEGARKFNDTFDQEMKRRRREDRRRLVVKWIGGFLAFVGINGSFILFDHLTGIIGLLYRWIPGHTLPGLLLSVIYISYLILLIAALSWFSDKTGLYFLIKDWIESWDTWDAQQSHNIPKFKKFPRRERRTLVRDLKRELDVITDNLYRFEEEAYDSDDEKLSDSVENINQVIQSLTTEADFFSSSLRLHLYYASWRGFVLTLEETLNDLELELKDIAKYHKKVQPLLKQACNIVAKLLHRIIDSGNEKE